jgi:hypothetical protein
MVFVRNEQAALAHRHAVKVLPRKDPATDRTIPEVAREAEERVQDLMQAFFTVDNTIILDNKTAKPIPLCTLGSASAFPAEDVEATCRVVFQKMMVQCQRGYTGYPTQDRLRDGQKGVMVSAMKPVDKDGSCRERFNAIRTTLRDWKSVCAAIMYSDDAILGLVNAPATISVDKLREQKTNDRKAKNKKESDQRKKEADMNLESLRKAHENGTVEQQLLRLVTASSPRMAAHPNLAMPTPLLGVAPGAFSGQALAHGIGGGQYSNKIADDPWGDLMRRHDRNQQVTSGALSGTGSRVIHQGAQSYAAPPMPAKGLHALPPLMMPAPSRTPPNTFPNPSRPHPPAFGFNPAPQHGNVPHTATAPRNTVRSPMPSTPSTHGDGNLANTHLQGDTNFDFKHSEFNYYLGLQHGPIDPSLLSPFPEPHRSMNANMASGITMNPSLASGNSYGPNFQHAARPTNYGDATMTMPQYGAMQPYPGYPPPSYQDTAFPRVGEKRGHTTAMDGENEFPSQRAKFNPKAPDSRNFHEEERGFVDYLVRDAQDEENKENGGDAQDEEEEGDKEDEDDEENKDGND